VTIRASKTGGALIASLLAFAGGGAASASGAQVVDAPHYVQAAQLRAMVATTKDGVVIAPVPAGPGATILMVRRDRDGEVEVHEHLNDEFVVQAGHAVVRVGGTVTGNRQTAPGEWRGGTMSDGSFYHLSPGDVLWIPAGQPHQTLVGQAGSFSYLAFKFEAKP
jgi:mannose-6-phosphate isomerase-like protein (cupin superfamily)